MDLRISLVYYWLQSVMVRTGEEQAECWQQEELVQREKEKDSNISDEFRKNNFMSDGETVDEDCGERWDLQRRLAGRIRLWLTEVEKKLDYLYSYSPDYAGPLEPEENSVCDPHYQLDCLPANSVEEIINSNTGRPLPRAAGRCLVRLQDGTELVGTWRQGRREGPGSCASPALGKQSQHGIK